MPVNLVHKTKKTMNNEDMYKNYFQPNYKNLELKKQAFCFIHFLILIIYDYVFTSSLGNPNNLVIKIIFGTRLRILNTRIYVYENIFRIDFGSISYFYAILGCF